MVERVRSPETLSISSAGRRERASVFLALLPAALAAFLFAETGERARARPSPLPAPEGTRFDFAAGPMALSSDGHLLAFVAAGPAGRNLLWVRPLDGSPARPLSGTEMASNPFWSPDGRFLGFFARGKLMKVRARRGAPETICDAESGLGGTWSREGIILFAPGPASPIFRVSSGGGKAVPVTRLDAARRQISHRWPSFLPDGRHFLYLEQTAGAAWESWENTICIGSLDVRTRAPLLRANSNVAYAPSFAAPSPGPWEWFKRLAGSDSGKSAGGHILFWRDNALLARPFDPKTLRLTGEAFRVAEPVQYRTITGAAVFAVSGNGLLAFQQGTAVGPSLLAWFDRGGRQLEVWGTSADYLFPRLSPDGRRAAVDLVDSRTSRRDVWLLDRERRAQSRLTSDPAVASFPNWSPDGSRIVYASSRRGSGDLYEKLAAGSGEESLLLESNAVKVPTDWSADGRSIAFMNTDREDEDREKEEKEKETEKRDGRREREVKRNSDLWVLSLADRKAVAYLKTRFNERAGQFSPDGRWIAYSSDESGREEIFVRSFPVPGEPRRISAGGGSLPRWRRDGKEILYVVSDRTLMSVEVKTAPTFEAGPPRRLFEVPMAGTFHYDVTPDGLHFLAALSVGEEPSASLTLVRDWTLSR